MHINDWLAPSIVFAAVIVKFFVSHEEPPSATTIAAPEEGEGGRPTVKDPLAVEAANLSPETAV